MRSLACLQAMCLRQWNVGMVKLCVAKIGWSVVKQWQVSLNFTQEYPHAAICHDVRVECHSFTKDIQRQHLGSSPTYGMQGGQGWRDAWHSSTGLSVNWACSAWSSGHDFKMLLHTRTVTYPHVARSNMLLEVFLGARLLGCTHQNYHRTCTNQTVREAEILWKKIKAYLRDLQVSLPVLDYLFSLGTAVPLPVSLERKP